MEKRKLKEESLERLTELYLKATEKQECLFRESRKLWCLMEETRKFKWKVAYWLGKKKALKCLAFRKINRDYVKCLVNRLEATRQELFRYWCAKCQLSEMEKTFLILDNKLGESR